MAQFHRKPPVFEIYHLTQNDDAAGVQAWVDGFDPSEFERALFDSVVANPYPYEHGAEYFTAVRLEAWRNGGIYYDLIIYPGEIILWELGESTVFVKFPASELGKYEPVAE